LRLRRRTMKDRDQLARKCHLYIPMELVYEAEKWQVSIDERARKRLASSGLSSVM
jgi:hypothetical protein